jgi:integrase
MVPDLPRAGEGDGELGQDARPVRAQQARGKCSRPIFTRLYDEAKVELAAKGITKLEGTTLHGLRATACVRLKREGFADSVISDMVGMSVAMVQRYTRFENKRATGKAVLALLAERKAKGTAS